MHTTIAAIVVVLVAGVAAYMMMPEGVPVMGGTQLTDSPREGNGMLGRMMDGFADLTWHPFQFFLTLGAVVAMLAGLGVYWRAIKD